VSADREAKPAADEHVRGNAAWDLARSLQHVQAVELHDPTGSFDWDDLTEDEQTEWYQRARAIIDRECG